MECLQTESLTSVMQSASASLATLLEDPSKVWRLVCPGIRWAVARGHSWDDHPLFPGQSRHISHLWWTPPNHPQVANDESTCQNMPKKAMDFAALRNSGSPPPLPCPAHPSPRSCRRGRPRCRSARGSSTSTRSPACSCATPPRRPARTSAPSAPPAPRRAPRACSPGSRARGTVLPLLTVPSASPSCMGPFALCHRWPRLWLCWTEHGNGSTGCVTDGHWEGRPLAGANRRRCPSRRVGPAAAACPTSPNPRRSPRGPVCALLSPSEGQARGRGQCMGCLGNSVSCRKSS